MEIDIEKLKKLQSLFFSLDEKSQDEYLLELEYKVRLKEISEETGITDMDQCRAILSSRYKSYHDLSIILHATDMIDSDRRAAMYLKILELTGEPTIPKDVFIEVAHNCDHKRILEEKKKVDAFFNEKEKDKR